MKLLTSLHFIALVVRIWFPSFCGGLLARNQHPYLAAFLFTFALGSAIELYQFLRKPTY